MAEIELKALISRLNRFCTRTLESAAGLCVSRTHYEIMIEHCFQVMLESPNADLQLICKHFGVDHGEILKSLQDTLETFRTGNSGRPVFSPLLVEWFQQGWLLSSLNYRFREIRSGVLLLVLLNNPIRFMAEDYEEPLKGINKAVLAEKMLEIVVSMCEAAERELVVLEAIRR